MDSTIPLQHNSQLLSDMPRGLRRWMRLCAVSVIIFVVVTFTNAMMIHHSATSWHSRGAAACPDSKLFFVHIPKTGGGTVEDTICKRDVRYAGRLAAETRFKYTGVNKPASHMLLSEQRLLSENGLRGARTFSIVRDPFARFVSEANFRRKSLEHQKRICETAEQPSWFFTQSHDIFAHCRPQVDFVGKHGELVDDIFTTEEIDGRLLQYLRLHMANPSLQLASRSHVSNPVHTIKDLTQSQKSWLRYHYAADFELYTELRRRAQVDSGTD